MQTITRDGIKILLKQASCLIRKAHENGATDAAKIWGEYNCGSMNKQNIPLYLKVNNN